MEEELTVTPFTVNAPRPLPSRSKVVFTSIGVLASDETLSLPPALISAELSMVNAELFVVNARLSASEVAVLLLWSKVTLASPVISVAAVELRLISPPALIVPAIFKFEALPKLWILRAAPPELSLEFDAESNFVVISDEEFTSIFFSASRVAVLAILSVASSFLKT